MLLVRQDVRELNARNSLPSYLDLSRDCTAMRNDSITGSVVANWIWGGEGDDELNGDLADDVLYGGVGNDTLRGGAGDDTYFFPDGVAETETLVEDSGAVTDGLAAGGGSDTITFFNISGPIVFDLTQVTQVVNGLLTISLEDSSGPNSDYFENLIGNQSFTNELYGNEAENRLVGGTLSDLLEGAGGNDALLGRAGDDSLHGGEGDDVLLGGDGNDPELFGEGGRDIIVGEAGADILDGGDEDDILIDGTVLFGTGTEEETLEALDVIRGQWGLTDRSYEERTANITAGVGRGAAFSLVVSSTVFYDTDADTLTGGLGMDWFFRNLADDTVTDLETGETAAAKTLFELATSPADETLHRRATNAVFGLLDDLQSLSERDDRGSETTDDELGIALGWLDA